MAALYKTSILIIIASLSPASADAFSSPVSLNAAHHTHSVFSVTHQQRRASCTAASASTAMKPIGHNSPVLSLSTLLFLRGGQQKNHDEYTVSTEETDLDSRHSPKQYGTHADEESSEAASVEMMDKSSSLEVDADSTVNEPGTLHSSLATMMLPLSSALHAAATFYTRQLSLRPILTKSLTAGIIFGLSDWVAQLIESKGHKEAADENKEPIVFSRILSAFLVGLLFFGPAANAWYEMIFKVLPSTSLVSTLQKAALGQIFFGPTFTCVFFGAGMIESGTFSFGGWWNKIRNDLPGVWASGLGFWPLVDFVSYKVVPVQWIPLFVNFCSFVWTIYLSLVANKSKAVEGTAHS
eukprot:CCRYP_008576-RH/>CCRYP_008576-RH protein AED:0.42 eAED:0.43 QI:0/0/0/1/0/0/2/0/352